jgi:hypothetical protein
VIHESRRIRSGREYLARARSIVEAAPIQQKRKDALNGELEERSVARRFLCAALLVADSLLVACGEILTIDTSDDGSPRAGSAGASVGGALTGEPGVGAGAAPSEAGGSEHLQGGRGPVRDPELAGKGGSAGAASPPPEGCGDENEVCAYDHADAYCVDGECRLGACREGNIDLDRKIENGCECAIAAEVCNREDDDCNGLVDDNFGLSHDPENCGSCGHRCDLSHAVSACVNGECRIVSCEAEFSDFDRDPSTGCEAARCQAVESIGPPPAAPDTPLSVACDLPPDPAGALRGSCADFARCSVGEDGMVEFTYQGCAAEHGAITFATCELARSVDMTSFDGSYGGDRLLEVRIHVKREIQGALNLWYGRHPLRKFLRLSGDEPLGIGCHVLYFASTDARVPEWCGVPESCAECPSAACLDEFREQSERWAAGDLDPTCFPEGGVPTTELEQFDFHSTLVTLVAEWGSGACLEGTVQLESIQSLRASCACEQDAHCAGSPGRVACRPLGEDACAADGAARGGVCGPPPETCAGLPVENSPCEIQTATGTFKGEIRCEGGSCACEIL